MTTARKKVLIVGVGGTGKTQLFKRLSKDINKFDNYYNATVIMANKPTEVKLNVEALDFLNLSTFELRDSPGQSRYHPTRMHIHYLEADIVIMTLDPTEDLQEQINRLNDIKKVLDENNKNTQFIFIITKADLLKTSINKCKFTPAEAAAKVGEVILFSAITGFDRNASNTKVETTGFDSNASSTVAETTDRKAPSTVAEATDRKAPSTVAEATDRKAPSTEMETTVSRKRNLEEFLAEMQKHPAIPRRYWNKTEHAFLELLKVLRVEGQIDDTNFKDANTKFYKAFELIKSAFFKLQETEEETKEFTEPTSKLLIEVYKKDIPIEVNNYKAPENIIFKIQTDILYPLMKELNRLINDYVPKDKRINFQDHKSTFYSSESEPEPEKDGNRYTCEKVYLQFIESITDQNAKQRANELLKLIKEGDAILTQSYGNEKKFRASLLQLITQDKLNKLDKYKNMRRFYFFSYLWSAHGKTYDVTAQAKDKINKLKLK